jgi:hypothetical protein
MDRERVHGGLGGSGVWVTWEHPSARVLSHTDMWVVGLCGGGGQQDEVCV